MATKEKPKTKVKKLKPIDRKIIKLISEGNTITKTAEIVGQSRENVSKKLSHNITIIQALDNCGVTEEYLANKNRELLEASRKLYNPATQDFTDVPDHNARNAALSLAYKVKGHLKEGTQVDTNIQINLVDFSKIELSTDSKNSVTNGNDKVIDV